MLIKSDIELDYNSIIKNLNDKVILITGAGSGLGKMAAIDYLKLGCNVAAGDINKESLSKLLHECSDYASNLFIHQVDVCNYYEQLKFFKLVKEKFGRVDVVHANAGKFVKGDFLNAEPEVEPDLSSVDVNVKGLLYTCHLAAIAFRENTVTSSNQKCITLTASISSFAALPSLSMPYTACKSYILSIMKSMHLQGQIDGFRCNSINPWFANTDIMTNRSRLLLTGIGFADIPTITKAFIISTASELNDTAFVIDEHGLFLIENPSVRSSSIDAFISRYTQIINFNNTLKKGTIKHFLTYTSIIGLVVGLSFRFLRAK